MRKLSTKSGERLDRLLREKIQALAADGRQWPLRICVAYSGGLDSSVLLHLMAQQERYEGSTLVALHVNHGLSPNADAWERHCQATCDRLGIELQVARIQVKRRPGESLEEQARVGRYAALATVDATAVALAHHAEDQAETVLLQMLRGAGPNGLAGMGEHSPVRSGGAIWRPLLNVPRAEIRQFGIERGITWIEDESNLDLGFRRNFVRHRIWPAIAEGFPAAAGSIARVGRLQADAACLLAELADIDLAMVEASGGLDCEKLKKLSTARQANLLRHWISRAGARAPSEARLGALLSALGYSTNDTSLTWKHENLNVYRRRNLLVIESV